MESNEWSRIIQWAIWGILMLLVMRWISRSRLQTPAGTGVCRLAYPRSIRIIGIGGLLFFSAIAVLSSTASDTPPAIPLLFLGFALIGAWLVAESFCVWHEITRQGITYRRLIGRGGHLRWSELRQVRYSPWMGVFVLRGSNGETVRVSTLMTGLPEFARMILAWAPPGTIDAKTLAILQETAVGRPPGFPI